MCIRSLEIYVIASVLGKFRLIVERVRRLLVLDVFDIMRYACMCSSNANNFLCGTVAVEESSGFLKCAVLGLDDNCCR
jgi:hypothetical protein